MSLWLIIPRDPLIFRDGKPFTATPGERSKSLGFPFPSTLAGAVRTRVGPDPEKGYDRERIEYLKSLAVRGAMLVELSADGKISKWSFPAPADALLVEKKQSKQIWRYWLAPLELPSGGLTDLDGLAVIGPMENVKDKPFARAPHFWDWDMMQAWLEHPSDSVVEPETLGLAELVREYRTHVSITPELQASKEGALFQTSGMEFVRAELNDEKRLKNAHPLALAVETEAPLEEGVDFLGGERRVVCWQKIQDVLPVCPIKIRQAIKDQKHCRLVLATPAHFEKGYSPWQLAKDFNLQVKGAALPRYQTISGWDYAKGSGGEPKPTRRLAPAGSVYFLNLEGTADIEAFVESVWLQAISDDDQSRRDGFGLALLGTWDGKPRTLEVKS